MGLLIDGEWHDEWYDTKKSKGRFVRSQSQFRNWVTEDGQPGDAGKGGFAAASDRYHLYVSLACPWAHRTLIMRHLKDLEDHISVSVVHPLMLEKGWSFQEGPGVIGDPVHHAQYFYEIYLKADPLYTGRVTVPVLWDKKTQTMVSNESSEIIRMFNTAFNGITQNHEDFYPPASRPEIDEINDRIYHQVNNGVYKSGFATTQKAYEDAVVPLFETLEWLDDHLSNRKYLLGDKLSEADIRLFTTLIRFDPVYHGHFKCNRRRLIEIPHLAAYTRRLYTQPAFRNTTNMDHIKLHYYGSHPTLNPTGIVPIGPDIPC